MGWGSGVAMSCGIGHRRSSDLVLLWLWRRPAAVATIQPLAWEPPLWRGGGPKKQKKKKKKKERDNVIMWVCRDIAKIDFERATFCYNRKE